MICLNKLGRSKEAIGIRHRGDHTAKATGPEALVHFDLTPTPHTSHRRQDLRHNHGVLRLPWHDARTATNARLACVSESDAVGAIVSSHRIGLADSTIVGADCMSGCVRGHAAGCETKGSVTPVA